MSVPESKRAITRTRRLLRAVARKFAAHELSAGAMLIERSGWFDRDWYLATYPDVVGDPLHHYSAFGAKEGRNPGPLFDTGWYLANYPEAAASGANPLVHFLESGAAEGRFPNPLFATVERSGWFDRNWYLATYPDVVGDPLHHYFAFGAKEGRSPGPLFDTGWYLATYPEVAASGANPLVHFLQTGAAERRFPNPLFATVERSGWFDRDWYLATYSDVVGDPLHHYFAFGAKEGRDPGPLFDTGWYLATYPEVAASDANPLAYFVQVGLARGLFPHPRLDMIHRSGAFDGDWYRRRYGDVANPLLDYLRSGAKAGRDPNPLFDSKWYLATYPDVAAAGANPLVHFLESGAAEGRFPAPFFASVAQGPDALLQRKGRLSLARYATVVRRKEEIFAAAARLREARMFDDDHYRAQYLLAPENDAILHFLCIGEGEDAAPYDGYDGDRVAAAMRAAGIDARDSLYVAFVDSQIASFRDRVNRDIRAFRPTWITPCRLWLEALDGAFQRTFEINAAPHRAALTWPVDAEIHNHIVLPIIAQDSCLRSVALPVQGQPADCSQIVVLLAETPTGAPLIDGNARYDAKTSSLVWSIRGGVLQRGRRYFLRIQTDRPTGLELCARSFDPAALIAARLAKIGFNLELALPCDWPARFDEKPIVTILLSPENFSSRCSELVEAVSVRFPLAQVGVLDATRSDLDALDLLRRSRTVLFDSSALGIGTFNVSAADLRRVLRIHGTDLALLEESGPLAACSHKTPEARDTGDEPGAGLHRLRISSLPEEEGGTALEAPAQPRSHRLPEYVGNGYRLGWPQVAIVTVLYRKADTIGPFLQAVYRQSYPGPITVVFVEDCSPGASFEKISECLESTFDRKPARISIQTVRNAENLGNCLSRNAGIAACTADIYVLIDADCLMNGDFVRAHVAEHLLGGADGVIGPYNIETNDEPGHAMLRRLEGSESDAMMLANMQDALLASAPVNTVTRNLSIRKQWFDAHGAFDPALSYSAQPDSGFGWEDIDIGARIYAANGRIRFTPHAFSIHLTHPPSLAQTAQVRGSAKNFRYLLQKHDFIRSICRRWYIDTADRIVTWARTVDASSPDIDALNDTLTDLKPRITPLLPYLRKEKRRYRVLTHRWHVAHQYEIYKLPFDFTLVTGTGTGITDQWSPDERPLLPNVCLSRVEDINLADFDLAIVHFDENVLSPDLGNGVLSPDWGDTFRWFLDNVKLPMVAVCHGTPPFVGQYGANPELIEKFDTYDADADLLRFALANVFVVVNSHQAAREWRFSKTRIIRHGLDPQEFLPGSHDLDVISHGVDPWRPHYRGAHQLQAALARLGPEITVSTHEHVSPTPVPVGDRRYSEFRFSNWLNHLGRHKIYLNTTLRSPMPRSRTEAMLCGVIPVSFDNHDVSEFIKNGVNGFYASSAEELADFCRMVCRDATMRERMSAAARATAIDLFNHDRFLTEWVTLVEEALGLR